MSIDFPARLSHGYSDFRKRRYRSERHRYEIAAEGQAPETMVIACCDSRVSPTIVFDAQPGELFVVRNIANLVPPYEPGGRRSTSAALEFAVLGLKVKNIVVLGHARCGGVRAFATGQTDLGAGDFIGQWMSIMSPAAEAAGIKAGQNISHEALSRFEHLAIKTSLANLQTFPCIQAKVAKGKLKLHGAYFSIASGQLEVLDQQTGDFVKIGKPARFRADRVHPEDENGLTLFSWDKDD